MPQIKRQSTDALAFERFKLLGELGHGGMGTVYRALDTVSGDEVALKLGEVPQDEAAAARLLREMRHALQIRHPNICAVYGGGTTSDHKVFLVMELIGGPSLLDLCRRGASSPSLWLETLRSLAVGLSAIHAAQVVHRDVKPHNVMFDERGNLKILDFGIARGLVDDSVTGTGQVIGTAAYMSPEQARAELVDGRSDLFSAALTATALATRGASRFASTKLDIGSKVLRAGFWFPPLLSSWDPCTPPEIEDIFSRVLTLDVNARIASAPELVALIDACPARHPHGEQLLRSWASGAVHAEEVRAHDADREVSRAKAMPTDAESAPARALAWRRASLLDPSPDTARALEAECKKGQSSEGAPGGSEFRFDEAFDTTEKDILMREEREQLPAHDLRQAAEAFRRRGHLEQSTRFLWMYCRAAPDDTRAARSLERTLFGSADRGSLSIARGIKTGGLVAAHKASHASLTATMAAPRTMVVGELGKGAGQASSPSRVHKSSANSVSVADVRGRADAPTFRFMAPALLLLLLAFVVYALAKAASVARTEVQAHKEDVGLVEKLAAVDARTSLLAEAEEAVEHHDHQRAIDAATRVLGLSPSVETGRQALFVRARAKILAMDRAGARRDLEMYLERTTDFMDPHIPEVKRLLASLDAPQNQRE